MKVHIGLDVLLQWNAAGLRVYYGTPTFQNPIKSPQKPLRRIHDVLPEYYTSFAQRKRHVKEERCLCKVEEQIR